ncbi:hypothetical protein G647_10245 [Cladophialophora carrionii CBS 160.54]|uniref:Uncharacterized protein n=1 Tax=Cladophialophora carrionii CBS 160.54 TaxID=1279043 RepID=V9DIV5_9EURO|nr:uncharacterized protein G647_10245 [Cladophialophora carrionii CBS 160.54]ETI26800.1 hypothetical protein G647_10245 [Cladophialophora carrionii CBS 160.54]
MSREDMSIPSLQDAPRKSSSMPPWFQLPPEIRNRVYEYAFGGLVFRPLQPPSMDTNAEAAQQVSLSSPSFMSLAVSRRWRTEVAPYLLPAATFDFTAHPGDPPPLIPEKAYEAMRHVVILETHCFSTEWLCRVLDKMLEAQTITIRKLRRVGTVDASAFDGPGVSLKFIDKVQSDPIKALLGGYRFDHQYTKNILKSKWPQRRLFLEGSLWPGQDGPAHSHFQVDLDTWKVRIEGLLPGAKPYEIQATEPAPVGRACFEDEEDMFGYLMSQYWASLQHGHDIY